MEYVEGAPLKGPLPLDETLRVAKQIAMALEAAHEKHITHRDLKPGNILVKPDGTVKVLDFGLAKIAAPMHGEHSPTLSMALTQVGMSPDERRLAWRSRDGSPISVIAGDGDWNNPDLSPDGSRLVASRASRDGTSANIWTVDLARGDLRQIAATPAAEHVPFWSAGPDSSVTDRERTSASGDSAQASVADPLDVA